MIRRSRRQRHQRGSVAVEFALTFPLMIGAFGAMFSIGQMLWAKYLLIDYARAAARACTSLQPVDVNQIPACVNTAVLLMQQAEPVPCRIGSPISTITSGGFAANPGLQNLVVEVDCSVTWDSAASVLLIGGSNTLHAMSSWPFLLPQ